MMMMIIIIIMIIGEKCNLLFPGNMSYGFSDIACTMERM
jgi:hypothetical protein